MKLKEYLAHDYRGCSGTWHLTSRGHLQCGGCRVVVYGTLANLDAARAQNEAAGQLSIPEAP